ncbi:MAG TPA: hypothetical protein VF261_00880 [Candidatus Saccharimonadales bacterium]
MNPQQPGGPWPPNNQPSNGQVPGQMNPVDQPIPPNLPGQQPGPAPGMVPSGTPGMPPGPAAPYGPSAQAPAQSAPHDAQFEFIMNPQKSAKKGLLLPGGSFAKQLALIGGGTVVLIIIIIVLASSVFGSHANLTPFIGVAQDQTELARVAALGVASASDSVAQNVAYTVDLTMTSAQQQTVAYLANNHKKIGVKQLALKQSTQTTQDLSSAQANSTFDSAFMDHIQQLLQTYASDLNAAYKTGPGPKGRQMLIQQYKGAELLITQAQQPLAGN